MLKHKEKLSRKDVEYNLGLSQSTSGRLLKNMVSEQIIYKKGKGKNTYYTISDD